MSSHTHGGVEGGGEDVGSRHHHVIDPARAQSEDVAEHGALLRRELGPLRALERVAQILADRCGLDAEQPRGLVAGRAGGPQSALACAGVGIASVHDKRTDLFSRVEMGPSDQYRRRTEAVACEHACNTSPLVQRDQQQVFAVGLANAGLRSPQAHTCDWEQGLRLRSGEVDGHCYARRTDANG